MDLHGRTPSFPPSHASPREGAKVGTMAAQDALGQAIYTGSEAQENEGGKNDPGNRTCGDEQTNQEHPAPIRRKA